MLELKLIYGSQGSETITSHFNTYLVIFIVISVSE